MNCFIVYDDDDVILFSYSEHTFTTKKIRHWMSVSREHTIAGEVCGFLTWMWVFYRAKNDLPVVLGWRHPFEHAHDPWAIHDHIHNESKLQEEWEGFFVKSTKPGEDDDDDEDEEEEDDE